MNDEKFYLGYQLGDSSAVALLCISESPAGGSARWATARSSISDDVPHDALQVCLERLGIASTGPALDVTVVCASQERCRALLERIACLSPQVPRAADALHAQAACAVFCAGAPRPTAVVVADDGVLLGSVAEQGLQVALQVTTLPVPDGKADERAAPPGRGPWPLVQELMRWGEWPAAEAQNESESSSGWAALRESVPGTQQGLLRGYPELLHGLRELRASGDSAPGRAAALVQGIVARDLAVFQKTARQKYSCAQVLVTGRLASAGSSAGLSFDERVALGAALLGSWSERGTTLGEAHEAPRPLLECEPGLLAPAAPPRAAGPIDSPAPLRSFADIFATRERRQLFFEQTWQRASAHLTGLIEPTALFSGDEFLAALRRVHEREGEPTSSVPGQSVINAVRNGILQPQRPGEPPYPAQWHGPATSSWRAAHAAQAVAERLGLEPWEATLRLTSIHHVCPRLTPVLLSFFEFFSSHCWVNAYYSPPRSVRGLPYHSDGTDVFVFQIEGEKHWAFDAGPLANSAEREQYLTRVRARELEPERRCVLRPGDCLYLPAHTCHAALATTQPSLHLTFAVRRHTALRFRTWWAQRTAGAERLNQGLQRYDTARGTLCLDEPSAREMLASAESPGELLEAYRQQTLRCDREATLRGELLANIDHV